MGIMSCTCFVQFTYCELEPASQNLMTIITLLNFVFTFSTASRHCCIFMDLMSIAKNIHFDVLH
jgi:hypothetical protein